MTVLLTHHFDGTAGDTVVATTEGFYGGSGTMPTYQSGGMSNTCARFTATGQGELADTPATAIGAYRGFYIRVATMPTSDGARFNCYYTASNKATAYIGVNAAGTLSICSPWSAVDTTASALTANTWYWVSWYVNLTGGTQELRLYDSTKTTLIDTLTGACRNNSATEFASISVGPMDDGLGNTTGLVFDLDECVIADDWPPLAVTPTGPTVRGVIVGGVEVPATVRGVIVGGVEVSATVKEIIDSGSSDPNVITFSDFTGSEKLGLNYSNTNTSIVGDGISQTTYEMVPNTSTQGSYVTGLASGATNQCRLIFTGGLDGSHIETGIEIADFTLQGTDQGHLYNGLVVGYSTGANLHDLKIADIPGDDISPPGETFSLSMWHANNSTVDNLTIDGGQVSATLVGLNNADTVTFTNCTFINSLHMPGASWQSKDITFDTCTFTGSQRGFNIENPYGGFHTFKNCTFDVPATESTWEIVCQCGVWTAPNGNCASTVLTIEDPVWDFDTLGPFKVLHYPTSQKPANIQLDSDIHLVIGGVDVTGDTSKFQLVTV